MRGLRSDDFIDDDDWARLTEAWDLSERQAGIVKLLFDGMTEEQAAFELGISKSTVHTHIKTLYRRLGIHNQAEFLVAAMGEIMRLRGDAGTA
jgi:DNA-binding NarL/FixJ family response regulator